MSKWGCPPEWDFGLLNARPIPDYGSIIKRNFRGADIYNHSKSPSHNSISRKAYHIIHRIQQSQTSPHITSHFRNKPPPHSSRNKTPSHFCNMHLFFFEGGRTYFFQKRMQDIVCLPIYGAPRVRFKQLGARKSLSEWLSLLPAAA